MYDRYFRVSVLSIKPLDVSPSMDINIHGIKDMKITRFIISATALCLIFFMATNALATPGEVKSPFEKAFEANYLGVATLLLLFVGIALLTCVVTLILFLLFCNTRYEDKMMSYIVMMIWGTVKILIFLMIVIFIIFSTYPVLH
jgi:hypothetical protein